MSEAEDQVPGDGSGAQDGGEQDTTQNLKSEFARKFQNLQEQNQKLQEQNDQMNQRFEQLMTHLTQSQQQQVQQQSSNEDLEDLKYTDPDKYVELKLKQHVEPIEQKITQQQQDQQRAQVISQYAAEYPELQDKNSELHKEAVKLWNNMAENQRQTPEGTKMAILEAVANQGIAPKSKRKQEDDLDEYIGSGGSGMKGASSGGKKTKKGEEVSEKTLTIAKFMGIDPNDPKNKERMDRIKKYSQKGDWGKYKNREKE